MLGSIKKLASEPRALDRSPRGRKGMSQIEKIHQGVGVVFAQLGSTLEKSGREQIDRLRMPATGLVSLREP